MASDSTSRTCSPGLSSSVVGLRHGPPPWWPSSAVLRPPIYRFRQNCHDLNWDRSFQIRVHRLILNQWNNSPIRTRKRLKNKNHKTTISHNNHKNRNQIENAQNNDNLYLYKEGINPYNFRTKEKRSRRIFLIELSPKARSHPTFPCFKHWVWDTKASVTNSCMRSSFETTIDMQE